jgi:UDP-2,3-diacylglucosamine pyrophosphatase LpxH
MPLSKMAREAQITVDFCNFMEQATPDEIDLLGAFFHKWEDPDISNFEEAVMQTLELIEDSTLNLRNKLKENSCQTTTT